MAEDTKYSPIDIEAAMIRNALRLAGREKGLAARLLGIGETELEIRLKLHGLALDEPPER